MRAAAILENPLPKGIAPVVTQSPHQGTQWNYMTAGATISMFPSLVLTILMHHHILEGAAIGPGFGGP